MVWLYSNASLASSSSTHPASTRFPKFFLDCANTDRVAQHTRSLELGSGGVRREDLHSDQAHKITKNSVGEGRHGAGESLY